MCRVTKNYFRHHQIGPTPTLSAIAYDLMFSDARNMQHVLETQAQT